MKVLAILSLCAFVAVQGRSAVVSSNRSSVALGDHPWILHLRIAVSTSGLLSSCAGSLIHERWALTSATCVADSRFIWIRYGAVTLINPSLVTETSVNPTAEVPLVIAHSTVDMAIININRAVKTTANIAPVSVVSGSTPESTTFCAYGDDGADGPGETLKCFDVTLTTEDDQITATSDDGAFTSYDLGAPLVSDGVQIGVLTGSDGVCLPIADYVSWIEETAGITLS